MENNSKTPLYLINGPLGAGKTTFLRRLVQLPEFEDARVIENEFASTSVDTDALHDHQAEVKTIAGLCICCSTGDELADALTLLSNDSEPVIIEATGVANSLKLIEKLAVADMFEKYELKHAVFILDAVEASRDIAAMIQTYLDELKAADTVLISKTDLLEVSELSAVMEMVNLLGLRQVAFVKDGAFDERLLHTDSQIVSYFAEFEGVIENHDDDSNYTIIDSASQVFSSERFTSIWDTLVIKYGVRRLKGNFQDEDGKSWHVEATPGQCRITRYTAGEMRLVLIGTDAISVTPAVLKGIFDDAK